MTSGMVLSAGELGMIREWYTIAVKAVGSHNVPGQALARQIGAVEEEATGADETNGEAATGA